MITSAANQQIKNLIQINKKSKVRNEQDVFLVEGIKMFMEAPRDRIVKVYVSESFYHKEKTLEMLEGLVFEVVADTVFKSVSDTQTPQGILCLIRQYHYTIEDILKAEKAHLILVENMQDPGNLGTIFRTGEGAGVTGIILSRSTVDIYNPKTIRATMGSIYRMPFLYVEDLAAILPVLKKCHITTYAAHLKGKNDYDRENYEKGTAFMIGNEGNGLSDELSGLADCLVRIPMEGRVESLNAAIAASILMYEAYRQRR